MRIKVDGGKYTFMLRDGHKLDIPASLGGRAIVTRRDAAIVAALLPGRVRR